MSIADQLRKDGRGAGREEGRQKIQMIARSLISTGLKPKEVAEHTGLSLDEVLAIAPEKKAS